MAPNCWTTIALAHAERAPDAPAYTFLDAHGAPTSALTRGELVARASAVAALLAERRIGPGDRVLLVFAPGLEFVAAFLGCLGAGVTAVPVTPPVPGRPLDTLEAIVRDCEPVAALTTAPLAAIAQFLCASSPVLSALPMIPTDDAPVPASTALAPQPADRLAMLQYTSGSTGEPKGVMVSHGNLLHNEVAIAGAFGHDRDTVVVGWLPVYHDMGLIGNVLQPLHLGVHCALMSPIDFLKRPLGWLRAISRHRATTSGGPNFGYALCCRDHDQLAADPKAAEALAAELDLSTWRLAYNGAEPVRRQTLVQFSRTFAPYGFDPAAFNPCYGLAEATLLVTSRRAIADAPVETPVSCGPVWGGQQVAIVDPTSRARLPDGQVGEVWVSGGSVAQGYWRKPELTERTFRARIAADDGPDADADADADAEQTWLRTGDLGYLQDGGELVVSGRRKDLIIHRGRNVYPQDLELAAEQSHPSLRIGCGAAFGVELGDEEGVVLVQEIKDAKDAADAAQAIRAAVNAASNLQLHEIVLVAPKTLDKTSSGKIRRSWASARWREGAFTPILVDRWTHAEPPRDHPAPVDPATDVQAEVARIWGQVLAVPSIPLDADLGSLGGDSVIAAEILSRVEEEFGVELGLPEPLTVRSVANAVYDARSGRSPRTGEDAASPRG